MRAAASAARAAPSAGRRAGCASTATCRPGCPPGAAPTAGYHPFWRTAQSRLNRRATRRWPVRSEVRSGVNRYAVVRRISFIWPAAAGDVSHTPSVSSEQTSGPRQRATQGKRHRASCRCRTPKSRPLWQACPEEAASPTPAPRSRWLSGSDRCRSPQEQLKLRKLELRKRDGTDELA